MADDRKVIITLRSEGTPSNGSADSQAVNTADKTEEAKATNSTNVYRSSSDSVSLAAWSIVANRVFEQTKSQAWEIINYEIQKHNMLTDNYRAQESWNRTKNALSFAISLTTTVASAAAFGGPVGIALAGVALAGTLVARGVQYNQQLEQQAIQIKQQEMQVSFGRQMIGFSLIDGSVGVDR